eukprot:1144733-Pelagomonas_calceolata.AAC.9
MHQKATPILSMWGTTKSGLSACPHVSHVWLLMAPSAACPLLTLAQPSGPPFLPPGKPHGRESYPELVFSLPAAPLSVPSRRPGCQHGLHQGGVTDCESQDRVCFWWSATWQSQSRFLEGLHSRAGLTSMCTAPLLDPTAAAAHRGGFAWKPGRPPAAAAWTEAPAKQARKGYQPLHARARASFQEAMYNRHLIPVGMYSPAYPSQTMFAIAASLGSWEEPRHCLSTQA